MTIVLLVIHFFIAAFLVGSILIQRSEGGALGGLGSGAGGFMTARGSANFLTRSTAILATLFFLSSIIIAIFLRSPEQGRSILKSEENQPAVEESLPPIENKTEETPAETATTTVTEEAPAAAAATTATEEAPAASEKEAK